jgi:hypothetical protein
MARPASSEAYDVSAAKAWKMIGAWSAPYITAANSPAAIKDLTGDGVGGLALPVCRCRLTSSTKTPSGAR